MGCNFKHAQVIKQVFFFFALNVKIKTVRLENHHVIKIKKKEKDTEELGMLGCQGTCRAHEALVQLPVLYKRDKKIFVEFKKFKVTILLERC